MSIIRAIQQSGASLFGPKPTQNNQLQEKYDELKEINKEKDVIITNNAEKINDLEYQLMELQEKYELVQKQLQMKNQSIDQLESQLNNSGMQDVIQSYEKFMYQITGEYETLKEERNMACTHLAAIEFAFADVIAKYERLKDVIVGYQQNQDLLLAHIDVYKEAMQALQKNYDNLKSYVCEKLHEANENFEKNDNKHISEMAKIKTKILQSRVKICELEKTISVMTSRSTVGDGTVAKKNNEFMLSSLSLDVKKFK